MKNQTENYRTTKGVITQFYEIKNPTETSQTQRFQFTTKDNERLYINAWNCVYMLKDFKVGEKVELVYNTKQNGEYTNHYLVKLFHDDRYLHCLKLWKKQNEIFKDVFTDNANLLCNRHYDVVITPVELFTAYHYFKQKFKLDIAGFNELLEQIDNDAIIKNWKSLIKYLKTKINVD